MNQDITSCVTRANTAIVVFAFVRQGDAILLIERANPPFAGTITIPGGHKNHAEPMHEACLREMKEETGLTLHGLQFAGNMQVCRPKAMDYLSVYFVCDTYSGELCPSSEGKVFWLPCHEALALKQAHPAFKALFPYIMANTYPFFAEATTDAEGRGKYSVYPAGSTIATTRTYT